MSNQINIQVRIERQTKYGDYHDALYFSSSEFFNDDGTRKLTDEQIEAHAQQRVANFEKNIEDARLRPPPPEPTDEELFGNLPPDYVDKFVKWADKKKNPPVDTLPGPVGPDPVVNPKPDMKPPKP